MVGGPKDGITASFLPLSAFANNVVLKWMLHRMTTRGEWRIDRKWLMSPYFCRLHWMTSSDYDTWWLQKVRIFENE